MSVENARALIFRKAALDRLSSPEQLDRLVTVADARGWIAAGGLTLVIGFMLVWSVLGRIATEVQAKGILVTEGGRVINATSQAGGIVDSLTLRVGDVVQRGQRVATIRQIADEQKLANARQVVTERARTLEARRTALAREAAMRKENTRLRRAALQEVSRMAEERSNYLQKQLGLRQDMLARQFTTADRVDQTRAELNQARQSISDSRAQMAAVDSEEMQANLANERELSQLDDLLADGRRSASEIETHIGQTSIVEAPASGRITEIAISEGALVAPGGTVLSIETQGTRLQAVVYIPTEDGKKVAPGAIARVSPATVKKEEYGTLQARVDAISSFPSTPQGMIAVLQNQALAQSFAGAGSPYEARLDLAPAATPTGYGWSSGEGPALDLTSGTTVEAQIVVREDAPLDLLLPFLRAALGMSR